MREGERTVREGGFPRSARAHCGHLPSLSLPLFSPGVTEYSYVTTFCLASIVLPHLTGVAEATGTPSLAHTHAPPEQTDPSGQTKLHAPQLAASVWKS